MFSIFNPFTFQVWLSVILSSILMTLVLCAFLQKSCKFCSILKNIISTSLGKSVTFKHRNEKLPMCSWLLGVMFLINFYLSLLLSAVSIPRMHVMRNVDQLEKEVEAGRCQVTSRFPSGKRNLLQSERKSYNIIGNNIKITESDTPFLDFLSESKSSKL